MSKEWKELEHNIWIFYDTDNGQIIGKISSTPQKNIFMTMANNVLLGEFISLEYAKKAVENQPARQAINLERMMDQLNQRKP